MSDTYTKLFASITESTIVSEPVATRWLWVTLLAMADASGEVHGSVPGLARRANLTLEDVEAALRCFLSPDPYSRTKANEGRRIAEIDGGWRLLNHGKYAAIRNEAERADYKRQWDRDNRPSGHARQSDNSPTVRQKSDESGSKSDSPTPPTLTPTQEKQDQKQQRDNADERPATRSGRDGRRGTRLPDEWEPSEAVREWARSEFPAVSLAMVLPEFVDHWRSLPGQRGCKLDWDATFRNRVRQVAARQPRISNGAHRESAAERVARINADAGQRDSGCGGRTIDGDFRAR